MQVIDRNQWSIMKTAIMSPWTYTALKLWAPEPVLIEPVMVAWWLFDRCVIYKKSTLSLGLFLGVAVRCNHQMAQYKRNNSHNTTQKRINDGFHNTKEHPMIGMKEEYIWRILLIMDREEVCVSKGMDARHTVGWTTENSTCLYALNFTLPTECLLWWLWNGSCNMKVMLTLMNP